MLAHRLSLAAFLIVPTVPALAQAVQMRVVATSSSGSVWRVSSSSVARTGHTAIAWFFVDHRRDASAGAANSRIRYRFECSARRATRLEKVVLGLDGRVLAREGAGVQAAAARGSFAGMLLEAACGSRA